MSVVAFREVLPRTFQHRFGEPPQAERRFTVTLTEPAPNQEIINSIGIFFGAVHPEYSYMRCVEGNVAETDRQHADVTFRYELPPRGEFEENPLARPDSWSFSTGGGSAPALFCYAGQDNITVPLTNTAGDVIEGLVRPESEMRVTISGNRPTFDYQLAADITNCINASPYLGGGPYTWLCAGISGQQQAEVVGDVEIKYWSFVSELVYRESTHLLFIPNVGWNYLENATEGQSYRDEIHAKNTLAESVAWIDTSSPRPASGNTRKVRAWVRDWEDSDARSPSPSPVALNPDGSMKGEGMSPDILIRRVNRVVDFAQFFGVPPF